MNGNLHDRKKEPSCNNSNQTLVTDSRVLREENVPCSIVNVHESYS